MTPDLKTLGIDSSAASGSRVAELLLQMIDTLVCLFIVSITGKFNLFLDDTLTAVYTMNFQIFVPISIPQCFLKTIELKMAAVFD